MKTVIAYIVAHFWFFKLMRARRKWLAEVNGVVHNEREERRAERRRLIATFKSYPWKYMLTTVPLYGLFEQTGGERKV